MFEATPNVKLISTTNVSAFCLGHAAANAGPSVDPDAQPTRMHHLCKNVQKAVQNTATRLLTIIEIGGPSLAGPDSAPEGRLTRIQVTYHKIIPVPVVDNAHVLGAGDPQEGRQLDGAMVHHHGAHRYHKDAPFLRRVHRALMMLGPWEGRIVAFVLGTVSVVVAGFLAVDLLALMALVHGRLRDRRPSSHVLGHGPVARPRHPRLAYIYNGHVSLRRVLIPKLHSIYISAIPLLGLNIVAHYFIYSHSRTSFQGQTSTSCCHLIYFIN